MEPIEQIRKLSDESKDIFLDTVPKLHGEIFDIGLMLISDSEPIYVFVDIPIKAIFALTHKNFCYSNASWREMLYPSNDNKKEGVTGYKWSHEVFDYFEQPLRRRDFPAANSNQSLQIKCFGNIGLVTNGVHRTVGAVNYLVSKYGADKSVLKKVNVTYHPIDVELIRFLNRFNRVGSTIHISWVRNDSKCLGINLKVFNNCKVKIFRYVNKQFHLIKEYFLITKLIDWISSDEEISDCWHLLDQDILKLLLDENWYLEGQPEKAM